MSLPKVLLDALEAKIKHIPVALNQEMASHIPLTENTTPITEEDRWYTCKEFVEIRMEQWPKPKELIWIRTAKGEFKGQYSQYGYDDPN